MLLWLDPNCPSILTNVVVSVEQHVGYISDITGHLMSAGLDTIEATRTAEADWAAHVAEVAGGTLFVYANSWYMGANIPGKPRVFLPYAGGFNVYRRKCGDVAARGYAGFRISSSKEARSSVA